MGIVSECLAVIAGLCVNQSATADLSFSGGWAGAQISISNTKLVAVWYNDNIVFPDRRLMEKVCVKGGCLYYHKFCNEKDGRYRCTISYNEGWWDTNRRIAIESPTSEELIRVSNGLSIVLSGGQLVPITSISIASQDDRPPFCRPTDDPECK